MNILLTGSTGLIGSELISLLSKKQHRIIRLVRRPQPAKNEIRWDPADGTLDVHALEGLDAVVHLAGESIAGRWTEGKKERIRDSRINGTHLLSQSLAHVLEPPKVLVSVSAIGYYGDRGEEPLDEESTPGKGFLADVCRQWEAAIQPAIMRGVRVVTPRLGMVLSAKGGSLAMMLPLYRFGLGGRIGSGRQYISWIAIDDLLRIIEYAIHNESLHGPVNAVSPNPVTNRDFSNTLARVLSRPALFAVPSFAARMAFGNMADEVLLSSAKVNPARLAGSEFRFQFPELEGALRHILGRPAEAR